MEEKREDAPHDVSNPGGKPNNINGAAANDEQPIKDFLGRLTLNDKLTLLVAVGSLAVALLGYVNSLDTSKLSEAVSHLSDLAKQTKREANGMRDQLAEIKKEAAAAVAQAQTASATLEQIRAQQARCMTQLRPRKGNWLNCAPNKDLCWKLKMANLQPISFSLTAALR